MVKKVKYVWGELAADRQLQERYAVEIRNRFHMLQGEDEEASERHQRFVEANQQAAEDCLTQIPKVRRKEQSLDPKVTMARKEMKAAYEAYIVDKCEDGQSREEYTERTVELYRMYAILEQEKLTQNIVEVEEAHENQRYGLSWQLISDISGRKLSQSANIQGESAEKRVGTWYSN